MNAVDPRYQFCSRIEKNVLVRRSEGHCRDEYACNEPDCPLTKEFGLEAIDLHMQVFRMFLKPWSVNRKI